MRGERVQNAKRAAHQAVPRRRGGRLLLLALCAAACLAGGGGAGYAQSNPTGLNGRGYPQDNSSILTPNGAPDGMDGMGAVEAERRLNALNDERQKALIADTAKLLKLAKSLNEQIAQSNPGELSPDQLRMVAEMEKLARSVREKMAMSLRGSQFPGSDNITQPFPPSRPH